MRCVVGNLSSQLGEKASHGGGVPNRRHVVEEQGLVGEEAGGHGGEGRVLGTANFNASRKPMTTYDAELVH